MVKEVSGELIQKTKDCEMYRQEISSLKNENKDLKEKMENFKKVSDTITNQNIKNKK